MILFGDLREFETIIRETLSMSIRNILRTDC